MESNPQKQEDTLPDLNIASAIPISDSPPNELNLVLPDSDDEYALAENKNSNSDISQLYDSISDGSSNENFYASENEDRAGKIPNKDVALTRCDIPDVDDAPIDDKTPKHDNAPKNDKLSKNANLPNADNQLQQTENKDDKLKKGEVLEKRKNEVDDQPKTKGKSLVKKGDKLSKDDKLTKGKVLEEKKNEVDDQPKTKGKSLVKKGDKLANGDKFMGSTPNNEKGPKPKEKGDQVPKRKQNITAEFEPQPSTSHGHPTLSYNAEPFTPIGQRLLDEIVRILPDFPYRLLDTILDDRRRRNSQEVDDDDGDSFSLPSPTSSIRIQSSVKVDFLGNPRFVPIRQNINQSRSDNLLPYRNPQENYIENPRANYMANYFHDPNNYIQNSQHIYQTPPVEYVNVQTNQNYNLIPLDSNVQYQRANNFLQYTGTSNFDNPPGYQQEEISDTFYQLPNNVQPLDPNVVYQYQHMPEGYDAYYPCMDNVDPVFIPQPDYLQPQPLVGPSGYQYPNVYPSRVYQPLMAPYYPQGYVPQVNMVPYYAQNNNSVLYQQMAQNFSPRCNIQRSPRPQSRSPRRARGADPNFVPSARAGTRQSRPRQRSRPQTPPRSYWATKIRLPTVPYRPFWYPRRRSPGPLMKPSNNNHNPAMLPIYKTMQHNGLGMVIPPRSSHELTNEIISPIPSPIPSPRRNRSPDREPEKSFDRAPYREPERPPEKPPPDRPPQRSLPSRSPQISPQRLSRELHSNMSAHNSPQIMSLPLSPQMAPPRPRRILHRQPEFERENRLAANRNVNRVIRSPRKCRIERLKHNASYGRNLRYRHLLDDDEVDLLENLDLGQVRNVDCEVQALDLEEHMHFGNISVVHHLEHRSDTDLTTFTCRESSEFLSTMQRNETYDLQTLTRQNSAITKSRAIVKSVAVLTDALETRTLKTQTDVLDVKIPFKTIIPTKFKVRKNPVKSALKCRSISKSNMKSVTFSVKSLESMSSIHKGKTYIKFYESLDMSTTDLNSKMEHTLKLVHDDTSAQYTVFNKPATEIKSPRLVSIENVPSTSYGCQNVEILEDSATPNKIPIELEDYETPGQRIPSVDHFAPKKIDKFVSLKRNIPFQNLSQVDISDEEKITNSNNAPIPSTSGYQAPQRYRGPEEVKKAPKPQKTVSILERVPSSERILYCKVLNMDETPTTTPVNKIPFTEPTAPKVNKAVKKITTLAPLPRLETLPNNGFAIYIDPDPEEKLSSSEDYNTPAQTIPEVGTLAPRPKRILRLKAPPIINTLVYDTPGSSKDAPSVEIEKLSEPTDHKTPIMQKKLAVEVSSPKQQRVARIDGDSISVTLVYDTPGSSKNEPCVPIESLEYTTPVTQKMPEVVAEAPKRPRVTKLDISTVSLALSYDTPNTARIESKVTSNNNNELLASEDQNVADSTASYIEDPVPSTSTEPDPQTSNSEEDTCLLKPSTSREDTSLPKSNTSQEDTNLSKPSTSREDTSLPESSTSREDTSLPKSNTSREDTSPSKKKTSREDKSLLKPSTPREDTSLPKPNTSQKDTSPSKKKTSREDKCFPKPSSSPEDTSLPKPKTSREDTSPSKKKTSREDKSLPKPNTSRGEKKTSREDKNLPKSNNSREDTSPSKKKTSREDKNLPKPSTSREDTSLPKPSTSQEEDTSPKFETFSWADDCESLEIQPGTGRWQDPDEADKQPEEPGKLSEEPPGDFDVSVTPRRRHPQPGEPSHVSYAQVVGDSPKRNSSQPGPSRIRQLPEPDYRRLTILELTLNQRLQPNSLQKHFEPYMNRGMNIKSIGKDVILLIFREPGDARELLYKKSALGTLVTMEHASQRSRDVATRYRISLRRKQTRSGRRFFSGYD